MSRVMTMVALALGSVAVAAALALWPKAPAGAQVAPQIGAINVEGCTCSRPSTLALGTRGEVFVYHCVCPGAQCVIAAAPAAAAGVAPQLAQSCR
jgi:hypothetical protein